LHGNHKEDQEIVPKEKPFDTDVLEIEAKHNDCRKLDGAESEDLLPLPYIDVFAMVLLFYDILLKEVRSEAAEHCRDADC